jgi:hypothetical protein
MARITFKGKAKDVHYVDGQFAYRYVAVPQFTRQHCDMAAFRQHPKYGGYANSDMFPGMLNRIRDTLFKNGMLKLDDVPESVAVDDTGFLVSVSIEV